ncbi:MAG TPA: SDR family NAD(P)-dependent oxidoreductase, partial [Thermoanaerobaculia bacterium]|nr:SDR family NAD(P)-dependent oxidoreductase [Thermoanaerobaculia bacterium]
MVDFIEYVVAELKSKRLSKTNAAALVRQFSRRSSIPAPASASVIHPLLHRNTSDLSEQRYRSTFAGDEFFLVDHQVKTSGHAGQKVLPGVAYLEMVRAAIEQALPAKPESTLLELHGTVWAQPIVVAGDKQVSIGLFANDNDGVDYEICSEDAERRIVHCQGRAVFSPQQAPARLDLDQIESRMGQGQIEPDAVYATCARMGLVYGPAFRGITLIKRGSGELLAQLRLPNVVAESAGDYVLHPSLMDGALQAAVGLMESGSGGTRPRIPFALEVLRIVSPCVPEMVAWVRYAAGSKVTDNVVKLDFDLCDALGNVCVQMRGFSSRILTHEIDTDAREQASRSLLAIPVWETSSAEATAGAREAEYAEHHVILCELAKIEIGKIAGSLPQGRFLSLQSSQETIARRYAAHALACFERIKEILRSKPQGRVLVQIVVPGHEEQALLAGLSGLLKTAALENPRVVGQLILVPADTTAEELGGQLQAEKLHALDSLIRYADRGRQVLRWREVPPNEDRPPVAFRDDGVYLITGGLGGLGVLFAKDILAQTGQARVVLTGRSAWSAEMQARLDEWAPQAARLSYRQVDLGDPDQVRQLVVTIRDEYGQLSGILHSAGMIADSFLLKKSSTEFSEVLAPKVTGTFHLDQASHDVELDFFVLFSAMAGALGNPGQGDYAAANGFMDQFAAHRNRQVAAKQRHGRTLSIDWPLWQSGGMAIDKTSRQLLQQTTGMRPMQTATGMEAFHRSLALSCDQILVVEGDLTQIRRALLGAPGPATDFQGEHTAAVGIDPERLTEKTQEYLRRQFSGVLKLPAHEINPRAALENYGIDSILAMKLTSQLEKTFGSLSRTLFFEYQTIRELTEYFITQHAAQLTALFALAASRPTEINASTALTVPPAPVQLVSTRRFSRPHRAVSGSTADVDPIAIIGLSGRYPESPDIEAYWENLRDGKDCITEVPRERWDWREFFSEDRSKSGHHYSKWGG